MVDGVAREERLSQESNAPLRENGFQFFKMYTIPAFHLAAHLHMHDAIELIYVNEGSLRVNYDDKEFRAYPGDLFLFRSRGIHCMYTEECDVNNYYVLKISTDFLTTIFHASVSQKILHRFLFFDPDLKFIWKRQELDGSRLYDALESLVAELDKPSKLTEIVQLSLILSLLHEIYKDSEINIEKKGAASNAIYKAIIYVNDNFDSDISAETVAKKFGMSLGYFSRCFKDTVGKSFRDYVIQIRLNKAERLIMNSDMSIIEISSLCGYPNVSHFIASYKKHKGKTPLKTRKAK